MLRNMIHPRCCLAALLAAGASTCLGAAPGDVSETLRRQTQEIVDAFASGASSVWDRYLDPKAVYTNEDGEVMSKQQMVAQIKPLPAGVSGSIRLLDFRVTRLGSVAIANYIDDESENFHGHQLHCQYRSTDTWIEEADGWRMLASQIIALRTDPPPIALPAAQLHEYEGRYSLTPDITYSISAEAGKLEGRQTGRKPEQLLAEAPDVLFVPGKPRYRKIFLRDPAGRITGFAERREAWDIVWKRLP